ncbi:ABC-2 family transporter protein [Corynebacterium capitovis DSM 44611]|uniref:YhgE/Pip domain-containing protein n=1 Tax=Corynebacterium capitovis TaxID=131081 RepID=UPI0003827B46|nr:YhgE/Pip domain-containing protein [Corynebacterium capitovis]WKD58087.1 ABC-2 family transporter protein [Corynebacterium capitovis DSM 44611]
MSTATPSRLRRALNWRPASLLARILVVLALVIPLLISATFMWALWDPSKTLPRVPLAIVNEDKGAESDGEFRVVGDEVVKGLVDTSYLNFTEVSADEASIGLIKGDYLFVVTIPEDFSADTVSLISDNPAQSEIRVDYNDYGGSNGKVLTAALIPELQAEVSAKISETYATQTLTGLNQLGDGIRRASDGAGQLDDGVGQLQDGAGRAVDGINQLGSGATQLNDGAAQLNDGAGELNTGAKRLEDGAGQLADGLLTLKDGTGQLGDGAAQIDAGVQQLTGTLIPVLEQVQSVVTQVQPVIDTLYATGLTAQTDQLRNSLARFDPANQGNMVNDLNRLRDGTAQLSYNLNSPDAPYLSGVNRLIDGSQQLANGSTELRAGTDRLLTGTSQLKDGTARLTDGTSQLADGGSQLTDGIGKLKDGSTELRTKLDEGAEKAPTVSQLPASAHQMAVPIVFNEANLHPTQALVDESNPTVKTIESGISLIVIIVFGYLIMAVLSALLPHAVGRRANSRTGIGPVLRAFGLIFLINLGIMAVFTAIAILTGWRPDNWGAMAAVVGLIALNGAALFQFFRVLFGRLVGGLFSVGFFTLGLFVFGGVWPLPTIPTPLQFFHRIHPMSYARDAFMRATDGLYDAAFWTGLIVLLASALLAVILSAVIYKARRDTAEELVDGHTPAHRERLGEEPFASITN